MTSSPRLIYLPLGGAGEIGMNCYLYGYGPQGDERFILVDVGVSFPDMDGTPGVDLILPDIAWIAERADRLDGIFITHAHEDHVGALGHLYRHFRKVPVFARPFTAAIATRKMEEAGQDPAMVQVAPVWPETVTAGPFTVGFAPTSHSIPEASALVIDSPEGRVVHSGDFKIDPDPRVGEPFDPAMWEAIGKTGIRALICDSTNVFSRHAGRSESDLPEPITKLVAEARGMVVATTFASNIARVKTLAEAGRAAGRSVCLMGRAMKRMVTVAVETGVLTDFPSTISPEEATQVPRENLMLIVTGSQGERRAASAALSRGKYLGHELKEGDTFLFSSKTIPGNEVSVGRIQNALSEIGVDIVDEQSGFYHVSGHANRPDLERMHGLLKPQILVPNHGEHRHLREHCKVGAAGGMTPVLAPNGSMVELSGNKPGIVEHVDVTRAYLDGSRVIGALDGVVRDRMKLALNGLVIVALIIDEEDEPLEDCWVELRGLPEMVGNQSLSEMIEDQLAEMFPRLTHKMVMHDDKLQDEVKRVVRQVCVSEIGRKPEVTTIISRLMAG
ncbi:ribonuclease J [Nioella sp. MMSF_3534]|uniref:ribonuclease J n=1 Tax=Nioella sp. MMSF_3534 TaxID=3046720 RepID=UPI00273FB4B5|nr:ribonuclease J [Nioella sp. MMSF_3534]